MKKNVKKGGQALVTDLKMVELCSPARDDWHGVPVSLRIGRPGVCQFLHFHFLLAFQGPSVHLHGQRDDWLAERAHDQTGLLRQLVMMMTRPAGQVKQWQSVRNASPTRLVLVCLCRGCVSQRKKGCGLTGGKYKRIFAHHSNLTAKNRN